MVVRLREEPEEIQRWSRHRGQVIGRLLLRIRREIGGGEMSIKSIEDFPGKGKAAAAAATAPTIFDQGHFEWWTTTENGMEFNPKTPRDIWLDAVNSLTAMHESSGRLHFRAICA